MRFRDDELDCATRLDRQDRMANRLINMDNGLNQAESDVRRLERKCYVGMDGKLDDVYNKSSDEALYLESCRSSNTSRKISRALKGIGRIVWGTV